MDDTKGGSLSSFILSLIALAGLACQAALNLENVSPETKLELEKKFAAADFSNLSSIKHKQWTCDMYGVRSGLQVQRGIKLYKFSKADSWNNSGAQLVQDYKVQGKMLSGANDTLEDDIKLAANGQLISRLSKKHDPQNQVLAYSVCTATP